MDMVNNMVQKSSKEIEQFFTILFIYAVYVTLRIFNSDKTFFDLHIYKITCIQLTNTCIMHSPRPCLYKPYICTHRYIFYRSYHSVL